MVFSLKNSRQFKKSTKWLCFRSVSSYIKLSGKKETLIKDRWVTGTINCVIKRSCHTVHSHNTRDWELRGSKTCMTGNNHHHRALLWCPAVVMTNVWQLQLTISCSSMNDVSYLPYFLAPTHFPILCVRIQAFLVSLCHLCWFTQPFCYSSFLKSFDMYFPPWNIRAYRGFCIGVNVAAAII